MNQCHAERRPSLVTGAQRAASVLSAALVTSLVGISATPAAAATCASLAGLALPDTTITAAQSVAAGTYTAPDGEVFTDLPAFCRIAASLTPTSDSNIKIEVWMPYSGWNGRYLGTGNGGIAALIVYRTLALLLPLNYAVANTDMGTSPAATDPPWWPRADRPSREADRLRYPIDQSDDGAFQADHRGVLWRAFETLVFLGVLNRRWTSPA